MAKTTAPLLSFGASGAIAKTQVYSKWRGVAYARRHVIPANPNSTGQQSTRNVFRTMTEAWKVAPALLVAPWNAYAAGQSFLGRNAFIGQNIGQMRGESDMQLFVGSPGAKGGLPPTSISLTAGSGQIQVDFTNPDAPIGWTLDSAIAVAVPDQDPGLTFGGPFTAAEDATTQAQVTLTGLDTVLHVVVAWLEWTKANGQTAYSASLIDTATPTA